ncbi:hypothetical protein GCM10010470_47460 [Saccharopolyspora taberi]|uniref:Uncharacterized protein n=1 Tax=Saccharopolyspora taberi TaxID=60895 RepID=A0ABN3VIL4_9PSEU
MPGVVGALPNPHRLKDGWDGPSKGPVAGGGLSDRDVWLVRKSGGDVHPTSKTAGQKISAELKRNFRYQKPQVKRLTWGKRVSEGGGVAH